MAGHFAVMVGGVKLGQSGVQGLECVGRSVASWADGVVTITGHRYILDGNGPWHKHREAYIQQWGKSSCG